MIRLVQACFAAVTFELLRMHNADDTAAQFFGTAVVGEKDMVMSATFRP